MDTEHHGQLVIEVAMDGNDDVTVMGELEVDENGQKWGLRSTSVGDQILVGNTKYKVAPCGFEKI